MSASRRMRLTVLVAVTGLLLSFAALPASAGDVRTYEVTIDNLTDAQPFTPPVVTAHRPSTDVFSVGHQASSGIQQIAENGNNTVLLGALQDDRQAVTVVEGLSAVLPGSSTTVTVSTGQGATRLSLAMMLICTNDGFTGLDALRLPMVVGAQETVSAKAYDAGTEINTEDFADIVPPCPDLTGVPSDDDGTAMSNPELAEGGVILPHPGIAGNADLLPQVHGWQEPVAEITVTRTS